MLLVIFPGGKQTQSPQNASTRSTFCVVDTPRTGSEASKRLHGSPFFCMAEKTEHRSNDKTEHRSNDKNEYGENAKATISSLGSSCRRMQ